MKRDLVVLMAVASLAANASATDLVDLVKQPAKYDGHYVELFGIARVPGPFYLFSEESAAAKEDLTNALLVRTDNSGPPGYRRFDRQWVRVTGVISSESRIARTPGTGLLLQRIELLRDRRAPHIKDPTVIGIFKNTTKQSVGVRLHPRSNGVTQEFRLGPHEAAEIEIDEGHVVTALLIGPANAALDQRTIGKTVAKGEIKFHKLLPTNYEYSPEWSDKRRLYYKITNNRIELVPASKAKGWAEAAGRKIP